MGHWIYPSRIGGSLTNKLMREAKLFLILMAGTLPAWGQQPRSVPDAVTLGRLSNGSVVRFHHGAAGWGVQISGPERFSQKQPISIELYRGDADIRQLAAGYGSVTLVAARQVVAREESMTVVRRSA